MTEFNKVTRGGSTGQPRVALVGEHPVQRMTELVEHCDDIIPGQQCRLAGRGFAEVGGVINDRLSVQQRRLVNEVAHPRPAAFVVALKPVSVEQRQRSAVFIKHLIDLDVRLIYRQIGPRFKGDAVQPRRGIKTPFSSTLFNSK